VTKEEREWAERFEQLREEFWERYRQARQNGHPTPFSWAAGLDLEHWEECRALPEKAQLERWLVWVYALGLCLDKTIPLSFGTSAQRIEEAIARFLDKFDPKGCPWRADAL